MRRTVWLALVLGLTAYAQDDGLVRLKVETRVVQMNVAVKDAAGKPVRDLRQEDFTVLDNGRRREIALFSGEEEAASEAPPAALPPNVFSNRLGPASTGRVTAILLDGLNTAFEHQAYARLQAIQTVERMAPGESIALYALQPDVAILQDYTTDRALLLKAVQAFLPRPPSSPTGILIARMLMRIRVESTLEAMRLIAGQMRDVSGRKSVVWVTGAFPPLGEYNTRIDEALRAINDANVAIYPVDARGLLPSRSAIVNIQTMQRFAEQTGGQAYYNRNDIGEALVEAVADAKYTYSLGFYLSDSDLDGKFHTLKMKVNRPGLVLHYRSGYSAGKEEEISRTPKNQPMTATMLSPIDSSAIGIDARVQKADASLRAQIAITMADPGDYSLPGLLIVTDARGYMLSKTEGVYKFTLRPERPVAMLEKTLPLPAGAAKLRIILRDRARGRTGSLTIPLDQL